MPLNEECVDLNILPWLIRKRRLPDSSAPLHGVDSTAQYRLPASQGEEVDHQPWPLL
jgi:hypothetical protein